MKTLKRKAGLLAGLLAAAPVVAADSGYSISMGGEYTRGDYGTGGDVSLVTLPLTLRYADPRYAWSVSIPYLWVSGPGDFVVGTSGLGRRAPTGTGAVTRTDSGMGDVTVSGSLRLLEETAHRPWVALTAKAKFGTAAAAQRLGTGENDYALQLELAKDALYGQMGYKVLGDPPDIDFRDIWYGVAGFNFPAGPADGGLELYAEQAPRDGVAGKRELFLYLGQPLGRTTRVVGHLVKGLSDASPDWGAGVTLRFAW